MQREGYGVFGTPAGAVAVNVVAPPPPVDNAEVVDMSVPARMVTGHPYTATVTMRNNGTTTWAAGVYNLGSLNPTDNLIWGTGRIALNTSIAPGQQYTFSFSVNAPAAGDYAMQWGMLSNVAWFGAIASRPVTVTEDLGNVTFIHTDGLGSPVARTDGVGAVLSRTRYEPYGYVATGATSTIGFTGHVNDADTGLTYMQQRYYDPVAGRFLSVDPVVTDTHSGGKFNRYSYASNAPYRYIDPDGRNPVSIAKRISKLAEQGIDNVGKLIARRNWRKSERELIEREAAVGPNGGKKCPDCASEVDKLDINHKDKWVDTQHKILDKIEESGGKDMPSRKEVNDLYGKNIDGKCPSCNRADNKPTTSAVLAVGAVVTTILTELVSVVVDAGDAGAGSDRVPGNP